MKRVTGIGGIFFKSTDPDALRAWYHKHLGIKLEEWGGCVFRWSGPENPGGKGSTVWSVFDSTSDHFGPDGADFMVNYRVDKLQPLLAALRAEGCHVDEKVNESAEFGNFGWVYDPDGNRIELWEPPAGK